MIILMIQMCTFTHTGASAVIRLRYSWGYGMHYGIYFSDVSCDGSEQNLLQCDKSYDSCSLYYGALGVICYGRFF